MREVYTREAIGPTAQPRLHNIRARYVSLLNDTINNRIDAALDMLATGTETRTSSSA